MALCPVRLRVGDAAWRLLEETARRLGLASERDHDDLRRLLAEVVPDPRSRYG